MSNVLHIAKKVIENYKQNQKIEENYKQNQKKVKKK